MTTIVELSAEQAHSSTEDLYSDREEIQYSLPPLGQGKFIGAVSTIVTMSKNTKATSQEKERNKLPPIRETNITPEKLR
jgi:hypothetical protein